MPSIRLLARAKINWRLAVTGRRADGYHNLYGLMQSISLCDTVLLSESKQDQCLCHAAVTVPAASDNLAYRAWLLLKEHCGLTKQWLKIDITKGIPLSAGLAGGSADAAAVLDGANRLFQLGLSLPQLQQLGLKLGADVPFCLQGGLALAAGVGEQLQALPPTPQLHLLLANGGCAVPTARVFAAHKAQNLPFSSLEQEKLAAEKLAAALRAADLAAVEALLKNDLEMPATALYPEIGRVKQLLLAAGLKPLLSGSGGTFFALTADAEAAQAAMQKLAGRIPWLATAYTVMEGQDGLKTED